MNPKPITRNAAIRHARENVSQLYMFGGQWRFNRWDAGCDAWRSSTARPWQAAAITRAQTLIDEACRCLKVDPPVYDGGHWTSYIPNPDPALQ